MANTHSSARLNDVKEQAAVVGEDLRELSSTVGRAATRQLDPLVEYVDENPVKAMLMAVGVGVLIGMFLRK